MKNISILNNVCDHTEMRHVGTFAYEYDVKMSTYEYN